MEQRNSNWAFDVFLSHNSKDKNEVLKLKGILQDRGLSSWLDKDQLPPGQNWMWLLEDGLANSKAIAVCFGNDGMGPWQDEEMQVAIRLALKTSRPVIPVFLPGCTKKDLPLLLGNRGFCDFSEGYSKSEVDNFLWGITGVRKGLAISNSEEDEQLIQPGTPRDFECPYAEIIEKLNDLMMADRASGRLFHEADPELIVLRGTDYKLAPDCGVKIKSISELLGNLINGIKNDPPDRERRENIKRILGGLMVLAVDPEWVIKNRQENQDEDQKMHTHQIHYPGKRLKLIYKEQFINLLPLILNAMVGNAIQMEKLLVDAMDSDSNCMPNVQERFKGVLSEDKKVEFKIFFQKSLLKRIMSLDDVEDHEISDEMKILHNIVKDKYVGLDSRPLYSVDLAYLKHMDTLKAVLEGVTYYIIKPLGGSESQLIIDVKLWTRRLHELNQLLNHP